MLNLKDPFVIGFKKELLRWNQQISLVSRQDTSRVLDTLLYQSISGFSVLQEHVNSFVDKPFDNSGTLVVDNPVDNPVDGLLYFDLGSGGGLPGVIWAQQLMQSSLYCQAYLVEPREKRSWFLDRVLRMNSMASTSSGSFCKVISGRWGEKFPFVFDKMNNPLVVISMKALHLDDEIVLNGLSSFFSSSRLRGRVIICRYYPEGQQVDAELKQSLLLPAEGSALDGVPSGHFEGGLALPVPAGGFLPASLVISRYRF